MDRWHTSADYKSNRYFSIFWASVVCVHRQFTLHSHRSLLFVPARQHEGVDVVYRVQCGAGKKVWTVVRMTGIPLDGRKCLVRLSSARSYLYTARGTLRCFIMLIFSTCRNLLQLVKDRYVWKWFTFCAPSRHYFVFRAFHFAQYALRIWKSMNMATREALVGGADIWFVFHLCTYM